MDSNLDDKERNSAVYQLSWQHNDQDGPIDSELTRALVQLAQTSADPQTRLSTWWPLRNMAGPEIMEPVIGALRDDPDVDVRITAADVLADRFLEEPDIREALAGSMKSDPSPLVRRKVERILRMGRQ